jgi:hypothetical protein
MHYVTLCSYVFLWYLILLCNGTVSNMMQLLAIVCNNEGNHLQMQYSMVQAMFWVTNC